MPEGYIKKKGSTIPFGYRLSNSTKGYLAPIPEQLSLLQKYINSVLAEELSLREASASLSIEAERKISHVGLSKLVQKQNLTPKYRYSKEQKRKNELAKQKKELAKAKKKVAYKEAKLKAEELVIKKATEQTPSNIVTEEELEQVAPSVQEIIKDSKVIFHPNEGPQTDFLAADEKDVLYGGAAGGGKSYAMIIDPLRYCHKKAHRALILRRSMPELREMIDKSRELYPLAFPGAKFREVEKLWNFPSGAKVEFGFLERDADVYRYQGQAYSWIGFDEITHLPTEFSWNYLASRLRTTDPEIKTYLRCTANPGGVIEAGTLSETSDKVGSQLAIVKETFASTPTTPSGYSIANEQESNVNGIPTKRFTFLKPGVLSRNISERNGGNTTTGKLRTEVVEAFGETPTTTISGVKIGEAISNVEGIPTKRLTFATGSGEISRSSRQSTGALAGTTELTVTTYGEASTAGSVLIGSSDFEEDGYKRFVRTFLTGTITGVKQTYQDVVAVDVPGEVNCTTGNGTTGAGGSVAIVEVTPRRSKRVTATVTIEVTNATPTTFAAAYDLGSISCSVTSVRESFNRSAGFLETNQGYSLSATNQAYPGCFITNAVSNGTVSYPSTIRSEGAQPDAISKTTTKCTAVGSSSNTGWVETGILKRKSRPILTDLSGTTYYEVITWTV